MLFPDFFTRDGSLRRRQDSERQVHQDIFDKICTADRRAAPGLKQGKVQGIAAARLPGKKSRLQQNQQIHQQIENRLKKTMIMQRKTSKNILFSKRSTSSHALSAGVRMTS